VTWTKSEENPKKEKKQIRLKTTGMGVAKEETRPRKGVFYSGRGTLSTRNKVQEDEKAKKGGYVQHREKPTSKKV